MEDVVDAGGRLAAQGAHPAAAALGEAVGQFALQRVVDVGVGHVYAVASQDDGVLALADVLGQEVGLSGSLDHTDGVGAVDGFEQAVVLHVVAVGLEVVGVLERVVGASRLQMDVVDAEYLAVDVDVGPLCAVVAGRELDGCALLDGEAAVDDVAVVEAVLHIGEVLLVTLGIALVAAVVVVLLHTEDVDLLLLHFGKDVLCDEAGGLTSEAGHVVGGDLQARLLATRLVDGAELVECPGVWDAAQEGDEGDAGPVPPAEDEPVEEQDEVAQHQQGQDVDEQCARHIACGKHIASEKTNYREYHHQHGEAEDHE